MYYNTSNFKIVIGNVRKFNNTNKESTCIPSAYKKHLVHFLKKYIVPLQSAGQKHLEIQDLSIVQKYEKNDKLQDV